MITNNQFVSIKKLTGKSIIRFAARHNLREIQAELGADSHIDVARTPQNVLLAGPAIAADVSRQANALMNDEGIGKLRKDAVRALEIIVSLPVVSSANRLQFFPMRWNGFGNSSGFQSSQRSFTVMKQLRIAIFFSCRSSTAA